MMYGPTVFHRFLFFFSVVRLESFHLITRGIDCRKILIDRAIEEQLHQPITAPYRTHPIGIDPQHMSPPLVYS
jgi:hypothetical protein